MNTKRTTPIGEHDVLSIAEVMAELGFSRQKVKSFLEKHNLIICDFGGKNGARVIWGDVLKAMKLKRSNKSLPHFNTSKFKRGQRCLK